MCFVFWHQNFWPYLLLISISILSYTSGTYIGSDALCECVQDDTTIEFGIEDRMWCCNQDPCIGEKDMYNYTIHITCNGTALSLSDQCHGENYEGSSCNYHPLSQFRNRLDRFRSHIDLCQDNRYVQHNKADFTKKFLQQDWKVF